MNVCYTYRIGWSDHDLHYYGARYSKTCNPSDLWRTYFTSSKRVKKLKETLGDPDIIEIRKVFETRDECVLWEQRVIRRLLRNKKRWLNQTHGFGLFWGDVTGVPKTDEHKKKISKSNIGKHKISPKMLPAAILKNTGRKRKEHSDFMKQYSKSEKSTCFKKGHVSQSALVKSESHKKSLSDAAKKRPKIVCCIFCKDRGNNNQGMALCHLMGNHKRCGGDHV